MLSHIRLFCDPMNCSPPGSFVHGTSQAKILEWIAISFSRESSWPRDWTGTSCNGRQILYHQATWEASLLLRWLLTIKMTYKHTFWKWRIRITPPSQLIKPSCLCQSTTRISEYSVPSNTLKYNFFKKDIFITQNSYGSTFKVTSMKIDFLFYS